MEDGELLPDRALADADPDEKRIEEASGNAGASVEHVYKNAALVLWPKARTLETLFTAGIVGAVEYVEAQLRVEADEVAGQSRRSAIGVRLIDAWPIAAARDWPRRKSGESLRSVVSVLAKISDPELILRFLREVVVKEYRGTENSELAVAIACVGTGRMSTFLPRFVRVNTPKHPAGVLDLICRLGRELGGSGNHDWSKLTRLAVAAALKVLPRALERRAGGIQAPSPKSLDDTALSDLVWLANRFGSESQAAAAAALVAKHPALATPERTVPQALVKMRARDDSLARSSAYGGLWNFAAASLLRRSEFVPDEPVGWYIDARLECNCRGCDQLASFCRDSGATRTKIAVNQSVRSHLRGKITRLGLDIDFETERRGSPYKLVCTKNRNSHKQRLAEYAEDLETMRVLIDAVPIRAGPGCCEPALARLRVATSILG